MSFEGKQHRPESNAKRAESIRAMYRDERPAGMGFSRKYATEDEARAAKARLNRQRGLRCRYGIDLDDYDRMLAEQGNRCAICGATQAEPKRPNVSFHVDHNHETGQVRGLLCSVCNKSLGLIEMAGVGKIIAYLDARDDAWTLLDMSIDIGRAIGHQPRSSTPPR